MYQYGCLTVAGRVGIEPTTILLERIVMPLHHQPICGYKTCAPLKVESS